MLARLAAERPTVRRLPKKALVRLMEFVELLTFRNEHEAKLAGSRLRAAGILSLVAKDDAGGMEPHLQLTRSVKLRVPVDRIKDARRLLGIGVK